MATVSSYDPVLKQIYRPELVEFLTYKMRPLLGLLPKYEKFGGRNMPIPLLYSNPQGVSADFTQAQTNVSDSALADFLLTRVTKHSLAHIESEVAAATLNDKHAFISALKKEVDAAMNALSDALESDLFRSGTGSLARVGSGETTKTMTLLDVNDIVNFEVGMVVRGTSTDGGAYDVGEETVEAIDRTNGTMDATSAAWNTVMTAIAANDYLVRDGDAANGGSNVSITGLDGWAPNTSGGAPSALFGVPRSTDSRLYGSFHDGATQALEEAFIDAQSKAAREGGRPDKIICNNGQYRKLAKELGSKKEYSETQASGAKGLVAGVSYRGFVVHGDYGPLDVIAANKCPSQKAWALQTDTWTLASLGPVTRFDDTDGNRILRRASNSGVEARLISWAQLGCKGPVYNAHIALAAV